jgi:hypothetical protein
VALILLVHGPVIAQEVQIPAENDPRFAGLGPFLTAEMLPYWKKHFGLVDGRTNPQAIPYGIAMERAFFSIEGQSALNDEAFAQSLRTTVPATDSDVQSIRAIAQQVDSVAGSVRNEAAERTYQLCAEMVAAQPGSLNALDYAARFNAIEADQAGRLTAYYKTALSRLSGGARAALENYVDTQIRPQMTWGHDLEGLAAEVPEAFLWHRREVCKQYVDLPPSERAGKRVWVTSVVQ